MGDKKSGKEDGLWKREGYSTEELAEAWQKTWSIFERYRAISKATNFVGFDTYLMNNITLLWAKPSGEVEFELVLTPYYANLNGVMHGGAAGVIFDMCTTTALGPLSKKGFWDFMGGVTRSLNISYLKAVPVGATVRIHSTVRQVGRTMALIQGIMTSPDGKTVYCVCEHNKVAVPSRKEHMSAEFDETNDENPGALPNAGTERAGSRIEDEKRKDGTKL